MLYSTKRHKPLVYGTIESSKKSHSKEIYAISSIPQKTDNGNSVYNFAAKFIKLFHHEKLFFKCNMDTFEGKLSKKYHLPLPEQ
jgi:hypothetical protein